MDGVLQRPTTFDTVTGIVSAAVYLLVALAAFARAPTDSRTRTFFTIAIAGLAPYLLPGVMGRLGTGWLVGAAVLTTAVSLAVGSVALFHFTQVFPSRRPWIRSHGRWLAAAYVVLTVGAVASGIALVPLIRMFTEVAGPLGSGGFGASSGVALLLILVLIPTVFAVGVVMPFGALLSLYKSWQEAKRNREDGARVTTLTILISQLAGGMLTILVVPLLHFIAPSGPFVTMAAGLLFGFGLLFPIAFAVGVWKYRLIGQP